MKRAMLAAAVGLTVFGFSGVANAQPNESASCVGSLSVFNQQHPLVFGTRSDIAHLFKQIADAIGITPGAIVSSFAHRHGAAADCLTQP